MTTNRNCKINFMTKEIIVSKKFLNASSIPFSTECEQLSSLLQRYPDYRLTLMPAPVTHNRPCNYTYQQMYLLISMQENAAELMEEFEAVRCLSRCQKNPYTYVLSWFKNHVAEVTEYTAC